MKNEKKNYLVLGSHAHVPSGAPECEYEFVYENRIRPFVLNLCRHSGIQAVLRYSGVLLCWIERNHPEIFMLMEDMVTRKQAEILGGGFYEPCFPLIPLQDRIGQIELMTTYIRRHFGKRPQGCWLPGFVWEQHLVTALCANDMSYTFLSQEQFAMADAHLYSPCISEDQGKLITIFPVSLCAGKDLESKSFSQVFSELNKKFQAEPDTASGGMIISVFPAKVSSSKGESQDTAWNRFFEEISLCEKNIETVLPAKFLKNNRVFKKGYFPDSCAESSAAQCNLSPRRFLIEHEESNCIYSKMIFTNVLINQLRGDKSRKRSAREELWKAQDSCFFSSDNGQFRGELRKSAYSSLISAQRLSKSNEKAITSLIQYDFDFDGVNEYLFHGPLINCYIQPKGAGIFELDYMPVNWNYLDCGTDEFGRRSAFADIITSADTKICPDGKAKDTDTGEKSLTGGYNCFKKEDTRFCFNYQYEAQAQDKKGKACFVLGADDTVFGCIEIFKCFLLKKDSLTVSYKLKNTGSDVQVFQFIPEIDLSFAGFTGEIVRFSTGSFAAGASNETPDASGEISRGNDAGGNDVGADMLFSGNNLKILDLKNETQIVLSCAKIFSCCISHAFKGGNYQATRILPLFTVSLEAGEIWSNEFSLKFSH